MINIWVRVNKAKISESARACVRVSKNKQVCVFVFKGKERFYSIVFLIFSFHFLLIISPRRKIKIELFFFF
jgi:hypothetical protein